MINWIKNYNKTTKKINMKNIKNFFVAWFRYLFANYGWKKDQAEWRKNQIILNSPKCIESGTCIVCFCDFPEKLFEPEGCANCYPDWMDKIDWIKFNIENDYV